MKRSLFEQNRRLCQCGREQCAPLRSFGPFARSHCLFRYVISGRGFLDSDVSKEETRRYALKAGQGFLIAPGQVNACYADRNRPWKYVWLGFDGLRAPGYMAYCEDTQKRRKKAA